MRWRMAAALVLAALGLTGVPGAALAHAGETGFVLLLPTGAYITAGVACVVLTFVLLLRLPEGLGRRLFRPVFGSRVGGGRDRAAPVLAVTSALSLLVLLLAIAWGVWGDQDPVENPLTLLIWTVVWIFAVLAQGIWAGTWAVISPFHAPAALLSRLREPLLRYPAWLGAWPALLALLAIEAALLVDPAPADPDHLARLVLIYLGWVLLGLVFFGPVWLERGEGLGLLMRLYGTIAPFSRIAGSRGGIGLPGWAVVSAPAPGWAMALACLVLLACGSFDGLNETFLWLGWHGINPLEFPGRSAVEGLNALGMITACIALPLIFSLATALGEVMAGGRAPLTAIRALAPAVLPIAFGYHLAHYLTAALIQGQYIHHVFNDLTGGPEVVVTTGFLQTRDTVRLLWLCQAGFVVAGHVLAIAMSHCIALRLHGNHAKALRSQIPLAIFMLAYTFFGLWLLASPRGL